VTEIKKKCHKNSVVSSDLISNHGQEELSNHFLEEFYVLGYKAA
jgi:hypothetical protein